MSFPANSLALNTLYFLISSLFVWASGTRLSFYMDVLGEKTQIGRGFIGLLLLGGITSLPELATVGTASLTNNAPLAVNNMLGSIAINLVFLAVVDIFIGKDALTSVVAHSSTLFQAVLDILLLGILAISIPIGSQALGHVSLWSLLLASFFFTAMYVAFRYQDRSPWVVKEAKGEGDPPEKKRIVREQNKAAYEQSYKKLISRIVLASAVILVAGVTLTLSAEAIAKQSGLGSSIVGFVLLSFVTGMPELSSLISAIRIGQYELALGNIFGTNLWNVLIVVFADLLFLSGPVLDFAGDFELIALLLSIVLTAIFVLGLLERRDKTILRMGYDSFAVIFVYIAGLVLLYQIGNRV